MAMSITGQRIKKLRIAAGLTQKQLSDLVLVSPQVISNWEREYTATIDHENIRRLAKALSTTPNYLIGITDNAGVRKPSLREDEEVILNGKKFTKAQLEVFVKRYEEAKSVLSKIKWEPEES